MNDVDYGKIEDASYIIEGASLDLMYAADRLAGVSTEYGPVAVQLWDIVAALDKIRKELL